MNTSLFVAKLKIQRERIDQAIAALENLNGVRKGPQSVAQDGRRRRRHMSADAKARISDAMKRTWAERKAKAS